MIDLKNAGMLECWNAGIEKQKQRRKKGWLSKK
jgi:hypothetical protein